jgi:exonuclease VII small subunit
MSETHDKEQQMWKKESSVTAERVPGAMAAYRESVDEFSRHATEFLEHIPTLTKAREAYQRAMTVSTELRSILDTGDETMKSLMGQLEQAVNMQLGKVGAEKKRPEPAKVEPIKATSEPADIARAMS